MALYDDYLNNNNLYSRPSSLMSDVNNYLGANSAKLPIDDTTLGSMAGLNAGVSAKAGGIDPGHKAYAFTTGQTLGGHTSGENIYGKSSDLISKFASDIGSLDERQQALFKAFVEGSYGDMQKGVSPEEWAEMFGVSPDYSDRFQGFPMLSSLFEDIQNVYAYGDQQRGAERKAAQQALISETGGGVPGLKMGRKKNPMLRRTMEDTLSQNLARISEGVANKYSSLLSAIQGNMRQGWSAAADIKSQNADAGRGPDIGYDTALLQANAYLSNTPIGGRDRNWRPNYYDKMLAYDKQRFDEWWSQQNFG
jgi:hypothetical protein|tara:strand:+ start:690 stop:1613 length:924 start_codon:yes stop_codon:yes gene_type:complete